MKTKTPPIKKAYYRVRKSQSAVFFVVAVPLTMDAYKREKIYLELRSLALQAADIKYVEDLLYCYDIILYLETYRLYYGLAKIEDTINLEEVFSTKQRYHRAGLDGMKEDHANLINALSGQSEAGMLSLTHVKDNLSLSGSTNRTAWFLHRQLAWLIMHPRNGLETNGKVDLNTNRLVTLLQGIGLKEWPVKQLVQTWVDNRKPGVGTETSSLSISWLVTSYGLAGSKQWNKTNRVTSEGTYSSCDEAFTRNVGATPLVNGATWRYGGKECRIHISTGEVVSGHQVCPDVNLVSQVTYRGGGLVIRDYKKCYIFNTFNILVLVLSIAASVWRKSLSSDSFEVFESFVVVFSFLTAMGWGITISLTHETRPIYNAVMGFRELRQSKHLKWLTDEQDVGAIKAWLSNNDHPAIFREEFSCTIPRHLPDGILSSEMPTCRNLRDYGTTFMGSTVLYGDNRVATLLDCGDNYHADYSEEVIPQITSNVHMDMKVGARCSINEALEKACVGGIKSMSTSVEAWKMVRLQDWMMRRKGKCPYYDEVMGLAEHVSKCERSAGNATTRDHILMAIMSFDRLACKCQQKLAKMAKNAEASQKRAESAIEKKETKTSYPPQAGGDNQLVGSFEEDNRTNIVTENCDANTMESRTCIRRRGPDAM